MMPSDRTMMLFCENRGRGLNRSKPFDQLSSQTARQLPDLSTIIGADSSPLVIRAFSGHTSYRGVLRNQGKVVLDDKLITGPTPRPSIRSRADRSKTIRMVRRPPLARGPNRRSHG
jgi:hypothetical protein